jgi:glycosyltransferase involved in cell wall biosynthesis
MASRACGRGECGISCASTSSDPRGSTIPTRQDLVGGSRMTLRNLLLVAYHFPPHGGSGVQRPAKLARYLPAAGWRAHVLTAGHSHYPLLDPTLEAGAEAHISRSGGWEPAAIATSICRQLRRRRMATPWIDRLEDRLYWRLDRLIGRLHLPETELLWVPAAIREARRLIERHQLEAVVTTSPPLSVHLVGLSLKRRLGIPWIADLRDPIVDNFAYAPRTGLAARVTRRFEEAILSRADHCVVTCPDLAKRLQDRHTECTAGRLATITNGFDPADTPGPLGTCREDSRSSRFTLAYVGAFYRRQDITPVLQAIRALCAARRDTAQPLEFRVVGSIAASQMSSIREDDSAFLTCLGYRPHREALDEIARADALLLMTPDNDGGRLCIPAKTFEYLAFGRHVIAVVHPNTALWRILAAAGNVTLLKHDDRGGLANAIDARLDAWRLGKPDSPRNMDTVRQYRRDRLAKRFAEVVETCVDGASGLRLVPEPTLAEEAA